MSVGGAAAEVLERTREALIVRVPEEAHDDGSVIVVVARGGQAISSKRLRIDHSTSARRGVAAEAPSASR